MAIIDNLKNLLKPNYPSLNRLEIFSKNLISNLFYLKSLQKDSEMIPVLKANAYGHGLKEVAKILNKTDIKRVAVDSFPEAQIVNRYFRGTCLILSQMPLDAYDFLNFKRVEVVVYNQETLQKLAKINKKIKIHLFYNSGMNREGIKDLESFLKANIIYFDKVKLYGFCSHLSQAESNFSENNKQLNKFLDALKILKTYNLKPKLVHLGNSAAVFTVNNKNLNAFRVGLSFYGYHSFSDSKLKEKASLNLKPALKLISKVIAVHELKKGDYVSYNGEFKADSDCKIITLPFGYYEGLDLLLSNSNYKAYLIKNNKKIEIKLVGRISMNLSSWQVTDKEEKVNIFDEVLIISENINNDNNIYNLANFSKKIPYNTLTNLRENIRKIIVS